MKDNLRTRNLGINSYLGILVITAVCGAMALMVIHVALDVPLKTFASANAYDINALKN
jgi:hypothetical protein